MTTWSSDSFAVPRGDVLRQVSVASRPHFAVLDGLRGFAALAVVLVHSFKSRGYVPNGAVAVDLFFILSGFVIAYSYEDRLTRDMTFREFVLRRFIRLYPMLFVGALGGAIIAVDHWKRRAGAAHSAPAILIPTALSFVCVPWLFDATENEFVFSFNPAMWSMVFEILANLAYAALVRRLNSMVLALIVAAGLAGVVWCGPLGGAAKFDFASGFPRVACGFFGGVLLFRLTRTGVLAHRDTTWIWPFLMAAMLFAAPVSIGGWLFLPAYVMLCLVVLTGSNASPSRLDGTFAFLGLVSYPIYLLHWITLYLFAALSQKLDLLNTHYSMVALTHLALLPGIGYLAARFYEAPVRSWLGHHLLAARPAGPGG